MSIRTILESMELQESAKRPADQTGGDMTADKVEAAASQNVDGTNGNAKAGMRGNQDGKLGGEESATKIGDPVAAEQKGKGTEVQGNTYGEESEESAEVLEATAGVIEEVTAAMFEGTEFKVDLSKIADLMESQEDLTEEFRAQAVEIFEAAVNDVVAEHLSKVNSYAAYVIGTKIEEHVAQLDEQVDAYLNTVVAEWAEENALAIQQGIRLEVAESFMEKMKAVFEDHYVEMPEAKTDMYEAAIETGEEILEMYQAEQEKTTALEEQVATLQKQLVIESFVRDLTETKAAKIRELSEGLEFADVESFTAKLNILAEGYVGESTKSATTSALVEDATPVQESEEVRPVVADSEIAALTEAMTRFSPRR